MNEVKNVVERWKIAKTETLGEINRLFQGYQQIKEDIRNNCGQSIDRPYFLEQGLEFNFGSVTVYLPGRREETRIVSGTVYNEHWKISLKNCEKLVFHLKAISIEKLRLLIEEYLLNN